MNPAIPLAAQIQCVRREIAMRERVYPAWIANGRMTPFKAEQETLAMKAVLETLEGLLPSEPEVSP